MKTTCTAPTPMYHIPGQLTAAGKKLYTTKLPAPGIPFEVMPRKCRQCTGCRVARRMDWALRLEHEAYDHKHSWFVTATYDDENLPLGGTLKHDHVSEFIKALRQKLAPEKIRYFAAGEYGGENTRRPHYHFIIFGPDIPDREIVYTKPHGPWASPEFIKTFGLENGMRHYKSELLTKVWGKGLIEFGHTSTATMQYVAKYHVDKVTGDKAEEHYIRRVEDGSVYDLEPEKARMSRNPGIGRKWIEKYWKDIYPHGYYTDRKGKKFAPPEYYDRWLEVNQPGIYEKVKEERAKAFTLEWRVDKRLEDTEKNQKAQLNCPGALGPAGPYKNRTGVTAHDLARTAKHAERAR